MRKQSDSANFPGRPPSPNWWPLFVSVWESWQHCHGVFSGGPIYEDNSPARSCMIIGVKAHARSLKHGVFRRVLRGRGLPWGTEIMACRSHCTAALTKALTALPLAEAHAPLGKASVWQTAVAMKIPCLQNIFDHQNWGLYDSPWEFLMSAGAVPQGAPHHQTPSWADTHAHLHANASTDLISSPACRR